MCVLLGHREPTLCIVVHGSIRGSIFPLLVPLPSSIEHVFGFFDLLPQFLVLNKVGIVETKGLPYQQSFVSSHLASMSPVWLSRLKRESVGKRGWVQPG